MKRRDKIDALKSGETSRAKDGSIKPTIGILTQIPQDLIELMPNELALKQNQERNAYREKAKKMLDSVGIEQHSILEALINGAINLGKQQHLHQVYLRGSL